MRDYLLLLSLTAAHSAAVAADAQQRAYEFPTFTASYGKAPTVDGKLSPGEWDDACLFTGFLNQCPLGTEWAELMLLRPVPTQTKVWAKWNDTHLFIAFRCERIRGLPLQAPTSADQRDLNLTREECVEIFFQPRPKSNYTMLLNPNGAFTDGKAAKETDDVFELRRSEDWGWNGKYDHATSITKEAWYGEVAIPFSVVGVRRPADGDVWKFSVGRYQPSYSRSGLTPMGGEYAAPQTYGSLRFSRRVRVKADLPDVKLRRGFAVELCNIGPKALAVSFAGGVYPIVAGGKARQRRWDRLHRRNSRQGPSAR